MSSAKPQNITVAVRVRPLTELERSRHAWATVENVDEKHVLVKDPDDKMGGIDYLRLDKYKTKHYRFDHAFGPEAPQAEVYEKTTKLLVRKAVEGYNACCFAYGATGAGKTFTMMGNLDNMGVIPLTLEDLMLFTAELEEEDFRISMQYVEIYNEKIKDLLSPSDVQLDVREVPSRGTYVAGAVDKAVSSAAEMMELIHNGNLHRTTEATLCNEVSSRSHAVLQLSVRSTPRYAEGGTAKLGKLSMIDLAGSERQDKTGNKGARLTEGANINRSLLALGNCINALADRSKKVAHVPYRDSKLTRLLKDSLGGNCLTTMIANVSPAQDQFDETLNSLKYANRAKNIKPRDGLPIVVNEREHAAGKELLSELEQLKLELAMQPRRSSHCGANSAALGAPTAAPNTRRRTIGSACAKKNGSCKSAAPVPPSQEAGADSSTTVGAAAPVAATNGHAGPVVVGAGISSGAACGAAAGELNSMTDAAAQPGALQMYQLLDAMELEDSLAMQDEAAALYGEHAGLLEDLYSSVLHIFKLKALHTARSTPSSPASAAAATTVATPTRVTPPLDAALASELSEAEEGRAAQLNALRASKHKLLDLVRQLPTRIVSVDRLQIMRLTLQNTALRVQRLEAELQQQTLHKGLGYMLNTSPDGTGGGQCGGAPSVGLHAQQTHGEAADGVGRRGVGGAGAALNQALLQDLLVATSESLGGGQELLRLAGGGGKASRVPGGSGGADENGSGEPAASAVEKEHLSGFGGDGQSARPRGRQLRSPHLSLAAVVPALMSHSPRLSVRNEATTGTSAPELTFNGFSPGFANKRIRGVGQLVHQAALLASEDNASTTNERSRAAANQAALVAKGHSVLAYPSLARETKQAILHAGSDIQITDMNGGGDCLSRPAAASAGAIGLGVVPNGEALAGQAAAPTVSSSCCAATLPNGCSCASRDHDVAAAPLGRDRRMAQPLPVHAWAAPAASAADSPLQSEAYVPAANRRCQGRPSLEADAGRAPDLAVPPGRPISCVLAQRPTGRSCGAGGATGRAGCDAGSALACSEASSESVRPYCGDGSASARACSAAGGAGVRAWSADEVVNPSATDDAHVPSIARPARRAVPKHRGEVSAGGKALPNRRAEHRPVRHHPRSERSKRDVMARS